MTSTPGQLGMNVAKQRGEFTDKLPTFDDRAQLKELNEERRSCGQSTPPGRT